MTIHVWIDADSCPRMVREYLIRYTAKLHIPVKMVANRTISVKKETKHVTMILCTAEADAADDYIVANAVTGDIVITRDIPLAARLVATDVTVLNDRGTVYSKENIRTRLADRDFNLMLAQAGLEIGKKNTYSKHEFSDFANCFDREIQHLLKN